MERHIVWESSCYNEPVPRASERQNENEANKNTNRKPPSPHTNWTNPPDAQQKGLHYCSQSARVQMPRDALTKPVLRNTNLFCQYWAHCTNHFFSSGKPVQQMSISTLISSSVRTPESKKRQYGFNITEDSYVVDLVRPRNSAVHGRCVLLDVRGPSQQVKRQRLWLVSLTHNKLCVSILGLDCRTRGNVVWKSNERWQSNLKRVVWIFIWEPLWRFPVWKA